MGAEVSTAGIGFGWSYLAEALVASAAGEARGVGGRSPGRRET